jgi:hypothetical protein
MNADVPFNAATQGDPRAGAYSCRLWRSAMNTVSTIVLMDGTEF